MVARAIVLGALSWTARASAQTATQVSLGPPLQDIAGKRQQPAYQPAPIDIGSFTIVPRLTATFDYDDNVFASSKNAVSDGVAVLHPALTAERSTANSDVSLSADTQIRRYVSLTSQDDVQYGAKLNGWDEIGPFSQLQASLGYASRTAAHGTIENDLSYGSPLNVDELTSSLGFTQSIGNVALTASADVLRQRFGDVTTNGVTLSQHFRDLDRYGGSLKGDLALAGTIAGFVQGQIYRYRFADARSCCSRSANDYTVLGGVDFSFSRLLVGEIGVGYRSHQFDNPVFSGIDGLTAQAKLSWYPTKLFTLEADFAQIATTSVFDQVSAVFDNQLALSATYELKRNIILSSTLQYDRGSYRGLGLHVTNTSGSISVEYLINRLISLTSMISVSGRSSSDNAIIGGYSKLLCSISLGFAL